MPTPDNKIRVTVAGINSQADRDRITLKPVPSSTAQVLGFVQLDLRGTARGTFKNGDVYVLSLDAAPVADPVVAPPPEVAPVANTVPETENEKILDEVKKLEGELESDKK